MGEPNKATWKQQAAMILKANLANLARKVQRLEQLSAAEMAMLRAEAGIQDGQPLTGEPDGEKPKGNDPEFAKNQAQLARILDVSRKTIQRYAKRKDAPKARSNGNLKVSDWREYLAKHDVLESEDDLDQTTLKARQILLQNRILEQKIEVNDGIYTLTEQVEQDTHALIAQAKTVLLSGPPSLAPQVVGVSIPEAEQIIRLWLHEALSKLQANPLGKTKVKAKAKEDEDA